MSACLSFYEGCSELLVGESNDTIKFSSNFTDDILPLISNVVYEVVSVGCSAVFANALTIFADIRISTVDSAN